MSNPVPNDSMPDDQHPGAYGCAGCGADVTHLIDLRRGRYYGCPDCGDIRVTRDGPGTVEIDSGE
jgi:DNA-directed RNA polymerase subunit RPC12/RpoP